MKSLKTCWGGVVHRLIDWIYPVGHVIATVNPDYDPNKLFKTHTWERFAKGQTLVGVNESDTDFSAAGKIGGEKMHTLTESEMPSHNGHLTPMAGTSNGKYLRQHLCQLMDHLLEAGIQLVQENGILLIKQMAVVLLTITYSRM